MAFNLILFELFMGNSWNNDLKFFVANGGASKLNSLYKIFQDTTIPHIMFPIKAHDPLWTIFINSGGSLKDG